MKQEQFCNNSIKVLKIVHRKRKRKDITIPYIKPTGASPLLVGGKKNLGSCFNFIFFKRQKFIDVHIYFTYNAASHPAGYLLMYLQIRLQHFLSLRNGTEKNEQIHSALIKCNMIRDIKYYFPLNTSKDVCMLFVFLTSNITDVNS